MKIAVCNLGCKVNQYECDCLTGELRKRGHEVVEDLQWAQVYLLNTCAVTNEAERKSRQYVSRCLACNPDAKIVVCGCASQNNAQQFETKRGVTYVSGVADKAKLVDKLEESGVVVGTLPTKYEDEFEAIVERTRAYVKIQDGCDNFCSYCLIPYIRGRSRSRSMQSVLQECKRLQASCKEIVVTGIDISSYGKEWGGSLAQLVESLSSIDCRIRLGSLEVSVVNEELLRATRKLQKFCPQFHLSLQSGSDGVLKKMNRKYSTSQYLDKVNVIREFYPDANLTTDVIVGFPTEDARQAQETEDFVRRVGFGQLHVFPYSARKGTVAAKMKRVACEDVKARKESLVVVAAECKHDYMSKFIGKEVEILTEESDGKYAEGYSREYIRCRVQGESADSIVLAVGEKIIDGVLMCRRKGE
ncbi:MAG: tRNA (N(6)-L-threonylcarbamoyladenosine(37)-C(2))-methylthiotransferase MtaB [Christensenellales bacterium]